MSHGARQRTQTDSFLETLNSQFIRGTESLNSWLSHLENRGAVDDLFESETWIRGLRAFFDTQHLPSAPAERANQIHRSFAPEFRIVRDALQLCERLASRVMSLGQPERVEFETFIEAQLRKDSVLDYHVGRILEQATPADSLAGCRSR